MPEKDIFTTLPVYDDIGKTGVFQLKRIFAKSQQNMDGSLDKAVTEREWSLDLMLYDGLKLGLEPTIQALYTCRTFDEFENWLLGRHAGALSRELVTEVNRAVQAFYCDKSKESGKEASAAEPVLTEQQQDFWHRHGYLVIPDVIDKTLCKKARDLAYDYLEMDETQPGTWYRATNKMQKIMVQLFDHPIQEEIRRSPKVRAVFEALWRTDKLFMSTDRLSFNPPERPGWQFPGPSLHWDVDLAKPVEFATQGLIYLTDVAKNQGAFCCVPGFQHEIDSWLASVPQGTDPQQQDWQKWDVTPVPASAGSLIVWHQALPHGSSANQAQLPRIVQYVNMRPLRSA